MHRQNPCFQEQALCVCRAVFLQSCHAIGTAKAPEGRMCSPVPLWLGNHFGLVCAHSCLLQLPAKLWGQCWAGQWVAGCSAEALRSAQGKGPEQFRTYGGFMAGHSKSLSRSSVRQGGCFCAMCCTHCFSSSPLTLKNLIKSTLMFLSHTRDAQDPSQADGARNNAKTPAL